MGALKRGGCLEITPHHTHDMTAEVVGYKVGELRCVVWLSYLLYVSRDLNTMV